ncbi:MAG: hypothetical protein AAFY57_18830, partial [Cyanobacteria bacterium J06642_2]
MPLLFTETDWGYSKPDEGLALPIIKSKSAVAQSIQNEFYPRYENSQSLSQSLSAHTFGIWNVAL